MDLQGAQTRSRFRGIGRYSLSLTKAMITSGTDHEFILVLNGLFPHTIEPIRVEFSELLPPENIVVWHAPGPVPAMEIGNNWRHEVAEVMRETFIQCLQPDLIHISSFLEGYTDSAISSVGKSGATTPVSVSLYDLIPLINPAKYLDPYPLFKRFYLSRIEQVQKADLFLAISEFSRAEVIDNLHVDPDSVINISSAIDNSFSPAAKLPEQESYFKSNFSIDRDYILYTGGADERKNLPALIQAFALLPHSVRESHQLVFAGKLLPNEERILKRHASSAGLPISQFILTGYVSDQDLILLYSQCQVFVFPSWHEGFGLPALEAMACGAPVIAANKSSLPEVVNCDDALFDPGDVTQISAKILQVLTDRSFRAELIAHSMRNAKRFSWSSTARAAIDAFELFPTQKLDDNRASINVPQLASCIAAIARDDYPSDLDLARIAACADCNIEEITRFYSHASARASFVG